MLSANFKPKRTPATSRDFLATARLSCLKKHLVKYTRTINCAREPVLSKNYNNPNIAGRKAGDAAYDEYSGHMLLVHKTDKPVRSLGGEKVSTVTSKGT